MTDPGGDRSRNGRGDTPFSPVLDLRARMAPGAGRSTGSCAWFPCRMLYTVDEPFSVRVEFRTAVAGAPRRWSVSRDLLAAGTSASCGTGALRIRPDPRYLLFGRRLYLGFWAPGGRVTFETDRSQVKSWLDATYALVPRGSEPELLDWDALERDLLQRRD